MNWRHSMWMLAAPALEAGIESLQGQHLSTLTAWHAAGVAGLTLLALLMKPPQAAAPSEPAAK